ncbi:hypothetical protein AVEN_212290-1 [Araneus ventricosus]|uniref:Uncharacterized protein n=1 Tax=Araneus ventricosus TaxID=182803 RepID=A0A4Y2AV98_ARAVE|nr:hypothetical protein AVEN_212290-1 [Araneus ventricosus]
MLRFLSRSIITWALSLYMPFFYSTSSKSRSDSVKERFSSQQQICSIIFQTLSTDIQICQLEAQVQKEQHLQKLATQTDSKSLITTVTALFISSASISLPAHTADKTPKRFKDVQTQSKDKHSSQQLRVSIVFPTGHRILWTHLEYLISIPNKDRTMILVFSRTFILSPRSRVIGSHPI